jgi:hypothetical protein
MPLRGIDEMPPGTIGFEAIGEVDDDDWEEQVEPLLGRPGAMAKPELGHYFGSWNSNSPTVATVSKSLKM